MVQQNVTDMPYVKIPQEVIAALVNQDTLVKMAKIVFKTVNFYIFNIYYLQRERPCCVRYTNSTLMIYFVFHS
jgi:hypothetical protein